MLRIENIIGDLTDINESTFVTISDELWKLGKIEDIKKKVDNELFYLHVGINMIGIWKSEGWGGIIGEQADLVPYIPMVLQELNLLDVREGFESVLELFPKDTVFKSDSAEYCDIYNFLGTFSYKVQNEKLKMITPDKRREMVKLMRQKVELLDELTEQYWNEDSEAEGWQHILDYIHEKY